MTEPGPTERWYAVHTQARAEDKAAYNLRRQGFRTYLPKYLKNRRHARRSDWVPAALFPRYLFVEMDEARARWRCIRSTVGVTDLVRCGDRPAPVPRGLVEDIRAREDEAGLVVAKSAREYARGERVRIAAGALADLVGLVEGTTDDERVVLLLDLLGRNVSVEVPARVLAAQG